MSASFAPELRSDAPGAAHALAALVEAELAAPVPEGAKRMADAIRARLGGVRAVLFYGSCLRRSQLEGVLDFYVVVDDYRSAYSRRLLSALNAILPPNVFYIEIDAEGERLRAKYAVFSKADFDERAIGGPDCRIWARFCQPTRLVWARDADARAHVGVAVLRATRTAVESMFCWLPGDARAQRVDPAALWTNGFRETYRAELRGESEQTIAALYASQATRFDAVAALALEASERVRVRRDGSHLEVESDPAWRAHARGRWQVRRRVGKTLTVLGLLKTTLTFDDWVSYALWKIERHSGTPVILTDRQRRHPFVFAWPVIFRLLRDRVLR